MISGADVLLSDMGTLPDSVRKMRRRLSDRKDFVEALDKSPGV